MSVSFIERKFITYLSKTMLYEIDSSVFLNPKTFILSIPSKNCQPQYRYTVFSFVGQKLKYLRFLGVVS